MNNDQSPDRPPGRPRGELLTPEEIRRVRNHIALHYKSQREFADVLGIARPALTSILSRRARVSRALRTRLLDHLDADREEEAHHLAERWGLDPDQRKTLMTLLVTWAGSNQSI